LVAYQALQPTAATALQSDFLADLSGQAGLVNHGWKEYKLFSQKVSLPSRIIVKTTTLDNLAGIDVNFGVICGTS